MKGRARGSGMRGRESELKIKEGMGGENNISTPNGETWAAKLYFAAEFNNLRRRKEISRPKMLNLRRRN